MKMKIMKKLVSISLCLVMCAPAAFAAYPDMPESRSDAEYKEAVELLSALEVINGDENGYFNPEAAISRAEFAKIACIVTGNKAVADKSGVFTDLGEGYWANGYINKAAQEKIILGYPDGTFKPESTISYSEALAVLCRILGFREENVGYNYPENFYSKARELELIRGVNFDLNGNISRKDAALFVARALNCDMNSSSSSKEKLLSKMSYTKSDEVVILATKAQDSSVQSDEVATSQGTYKTKIDLSSYAGKSGKLYFNSSNEVLSIEPTDKTVDTYTVSEVSNDYITAGGAKLYFDDYMTFYYELSKTNYMSIKNSLKSGDKILVAHSSNSANEYAVVIKDVTKKKAGDSKYALLLSTSEKTEDKTKKYYAKLLLSSGVEAEYQTDKNYDKLKGGAVKIETDSKEIVSLYLQKDKQLTGNINRGENKIGSYYYSDDLKIVDVSYVPENYKDYDAVAKFISLADTDKTVLKKSESVFYTTDAAGKVDFLITRGFIDSGYSYGIVEEAKVTGSSTSYVFDCQGEESTYFMRAVNSSIKSGSPARAIIQGGAMLEIKPLQFVKRASEIKSLNDDEITLSSDSYTLYSECGFYIERDKKYDSISIDDIDISAVKTVQLFSDNSADKDADIRIVVLTLK